MAEEIIKYLQSIVENLAARIQKLETNIRSEVTGGTQSTTVAGLPAAGQAGRIQFCTNGRKVGEGVGAGTGVLVYDDGVAWRTCDTSTTVAA